jgi:hypothetical protein
MDLQIDIELQGDLLLVIARGRVSFESASRLLKQIWDKAAESQVNKILVDSLAADGVLAAFERYDLGAEAAADLAERQLNVKVAFVGLPPTMDGFGVRIARNRGVITRMFSSRTDALNWLGDSPD